MMKKTTNLIMFACLSAFVMLFSCNNDEGVNPPDPDSDNNEYYIKLYADAGLNDEIGAALDFSTEATTMTIYAKASNSAWTATVADSEAAWMSLDPLSGNEGVTQLTLTIAANDVEKPKTNVVTFSLNDSIEIKKELTINQEPMPAFVSSRLTDSLALVAIYNAFDGDQTLEENWRLDQPINTWDSIFCENIDGELRVVEMRFGFNKAKGNIPAEMGNLRKLRRLWINAIRIKGALPDGLGYASDLKELIIKGSSAITALPSDMSGMTSLEVLNISGTSITTFPSSISKCVNLKAIDASYMQEKAGKLKGNFNELFTDLSELRMLVLGETEMTGNLAFCTNKKFLYELNIDSHNMAGEVNFKRDFAGCDSLDVLYLGSSPGLTGKFDGLLSISKVLRAVSLTDSQIGGFVADLGYRDGDSDRRYGTVWLANNEIEGNIPSDLFLGSTLSLAMNKMSGEIPQNIIDNMYGIFLSADRICPQKEGYGFTNCNVPPTPEV